MYTYAYAHAYTYVSLYPYTHTSIFMHTTQAPEHAVKSQEEGGQVISVSPTYTYIHTRIYTYTYKYIYVHKPDARVENDAGGMRALCFSLYVPYIHTYTYVYICT